jgi:hypothetical protein
MKKVVMLVAMVAFLAVATVAFCNPAAPAGDIAMKGAKKGAVNFSHKLHIETVKVDDCKTCHHKFKGEGEPQKCDACHKEKKDGKTPDMKTAAHKQCKNCHKKSGNKKAPTKCSACHKK